MHPPVLLPPAVISRLRHLDDAADLDDGLALGDQLLGGFQLADDLLRCVPGAFHGEVHSPVWPAEDSHSPWIGFRGPRQTSLNSHSYQLTVLAMASSSSGAARAETTTGHVKRNGVRW